MKATNPRTRAVAIAVTGTAVGAVGLGVLAVPAGAGEAPELPEVEPQALVESVLRSEAPALAGTVAVNNDLGLPAVGGMPALSAESGRVFYDGEGRVRLGLDEDRGEQTLVNDGEQVWAYNSAEHSVATFALPGKDHAPEAGHGAPTDPAAAARTLVELARETSTVTVDGTATVADRAAYELVLTPKPDERTLLREVRVAVDAETRLPLRLAAHTHGTTEPVAEIGFTDLDLGPQPAELFEFTPPEGAEVTELDKREQQRSAAPEALAGLRTVGEGWDTVLVARVPGEARAQLSGGEGGDLLARVGTRVEGEYGSGFLVETNAVTALLTDDGRVAVGAVPEPVLAEALASRGDR
ncbi:hypothetical protein B1813_09360 [Saccharomonospora piscinae]|uniref:Outer membrane lipoprotein-sorting protein n=1 Tax=Saccharomonospora piscinae TaxID=687388 RepID=A0A1V9A5T0_SACPI|nr:DUF2092 domain-containing protein [Saccharomonospora piscinae]OQO92400.1 hypothetical protein B1813_09360 [Saccharomonospora piscinae]